MITYMSLLWYAISALLLLLVQMHLDYISVEKVAPDLLLILTIFIALREGQFTGLIAGFVIGFLFDQFSGNIIGTNALSKMLAGFVAGYFYDENLSLQESIGSFRFLGVVLLAAMVHNIVYYFFYVEPSDLTFVKFFLRSGIAAALYTTLLSALIMLVAARKQRE